MSLLIQQSNKTLKSLIHEAGILFQIGIDTNVAAKAL
jgi:hypothetical protein